MSYPILFGNMDSSSAIASSFNSFGVVSPQTKNTIYDAYTGSSPTGPHASQFIKMTSISSGRPGGLTYTDIVLDGDFFICFFSSHGGDYYNALFLYEDTYKDFTHIQLGNANSTDFGYVARYGAYITPSGIDIWDGISQPEGSGGTAGVMPLISGTGTTGYIGIRRASGKFYTYYSNSAPGASGFSNMTLVHGASQSTYTGKVRLGIFVHDANDYLEVYSPGTLVAPISKINGECDGLGVSVANGADGTNVTGYTNTGMSTLAYNRMNAGGNTNNRHPLDYSFYNSGADFSFHTGHTFPDWWPMYYAIQVNSSTPKVLNQIDWRVHGNGIGQCDIFGSNRTITGSNFTDETLWTHLGRIQMNGGSSGVSDGTSITQNFNSAGLGYKWYMIKGVDIVKSDKTLRTYPNVRGGYNDVTTTPNGWAMYGLRLNKV